LANRSSFRFFWPVPGKIFAFGNLRVRTPNSVRGVVGWWYHVAPMVNESGRLWVLDAGFPAKIKGAKTAKDWLFDFAGSRNCKEIKAGDNDLILDTSALEVGRRGDGSRHDEARSERDAETSRQGS
jgi:hypothetical protein